MSYGILLLHVVLGVTIAAHGAQKLFGAFGGGGVREARQTFAALGFREPGFFAPAAATADSPPGLMLAVGLLTPLAALAIAVVMLTAIWTAHRRSGFWVYNGGFEYNLVIWSTAVAIAAVGGARFSFDRLIGWDENMSGLWWGVGVAALSVVISALTLTLGRHHVPALEPAAEAPSDQSIPGPPEHGHRHLTRGVPPARPRARAPEAAQASGVRQAGACPPTWSSRFPRTTAARSTAGCAARPSSPSGGQRASSWAAARTGSSASGISRRSSRSGCRRTRSMSSSPPTREASSSCLARRIGAVRS